MRWELLTILDALGEASAAELAERTGSTPTRVCRAMRGFKSEYRADVAPITQGHVVELVSSFGPVYQITPTGRNAVRDRAGVNVRWRRVRRVRLGGVE